VAWFVRGGVKIVSGAWLTPPVPTHVCVGRALLSATLDVAFDSSVYKFDSLHRKRNPNSESKTTSKAADKSIRPH
jgi:hypothetical protein